MCESGTSCVRSCTVTLGVARPASLLLLGLDDLIAFSFTSKPIYLTFDFLSIVPIAKMDPNWPS